MSEYPIAANSFKVHVDASFNKEENKGRIAWVVYVHNELFSTNIVPMITKRGILNLEALGFKIVNQIYEGAKIYTDDAHVWEYWKGKNKNKIYLINSKDNLADDLLRGKEIPKKYTKVPTYKFEYVKVKTTED